MEYRSPLDDDYYSQPRPNGNDDYHWRRPSNRHNQSPYDGHSRSPLDPHSPRPSNRHDRFSPYHRHSQRSESSRGPFQPAYESRPGSSGVSHPRDGAGPTMRPTLMDFPSNEAASIHPDSQGTSRPPSYMDQYRQDSYPKALTIMFEASICKLCSVELSSPIVAKMHYSGKQHRKKVTRFLNEWCAKTGAPMPRIEMGDSSSAANFEDYCELCDVSMTSLSDKLLHYAGKIHRKNKNNPQNVRKRKKAYDTIDLSDSRFGIGIDFFSTDKKVKEEKKNETPHEFECELCDVKAMSEENFQDHLAGKKHQEKMKKKNNSDSSGEASKLARPYKCQLCEVSLETDSLFQKHIIGKRHKKNLLKLEMNKFGTDKCEVCNLSFSSYEQYLSHVSGKKHEKACKEKFQTTTAAPVEKVSITCEYCPYVGNYEKHECDKSLLEFNFQGLEKKYVCFTCNMVYDNKEDYGEHKNSRRHLLCVLNKETGDKVIEELVHFYCFICKVQCRNMQEYTNHLFEPKHLSLTSGELDLENKTDLYVCSMCDIVMDQEAKEEHIYDKKHLRKSLQNDTWITLANLVQQDITTTNFNCPYCKVSLNSFVKYSEHLLSEEHMETMISDRLENYNLPKSV